MFDKQRRSIVSKQHESGPDARTLGRRLYQEYVVGGPNAHAHWYRVRNARNGPIFGPILIALFYVTIQLSKHFPSLALKRGVCRLMGMSIGKNVTIASGVVLDYFFPELVEIGDNTIVGMDAMVLTHEFLHDRWREGKVTIGKNVMIGARSTVLAGVAIGDNATISAMSLVHKCVPHSAFVGGVPVEVLRS